MIPSEEPHITVGILTEKKIIFELYGRFTVQGRKEKFNGIISAEAEGGNIVCSYNGKSFSAVNELIFNPGDPFSESFFIRDVVIGINFHWQRKEKQRFNHSLKFIVSGNKLTAINILPLEQYIVSVISSEMSAKCALHSLKAQAVVARSWIIAQLQKEKSKKAAEKSRLDNSKELESIKWYDREQHKNFDVCADDHCQRFQGITKVTTENARQAVQQTKGIVLLSEKKVCDTRYSKCCGGKTENFENVWDPIKYPYLTSVVDYKYLPENFNLDFSSEVNTRKWVTGNPASYCNTFDKTILSQILIDYDQETTNFFRWRVIYNQEQISYIIKDKTGDDFGNIVDLIPFQRGESARLVKLKIIGTKKSLIIGKELEIRRILSAKHLYSSAFVVDKIQGDFKVPEKFILRGAGWGHGVGLCQVGAAVMAEKGFQFDEILSHYFSGASIKKIY